MSRWHATLFQEGGQWFLSDKGSTNGTFLDAQRLAADQPVALRNGSIAEIGDLKLQFKLGAGAAKKVDDSVRVHAPAEELEAPPEPSPLLSHLLDPRSKIQAWSEGDIKLRVVDIIDETHDCKTFRMVGESPVLFSFKPGQFVTLRLPIDGKDVRRSYSISSSPSRPHCLELTIKRVPGGLVSNWMCDKVKLGDVIGMKGPSGKFSCFNFPSRKLLFIGAGSGITPVMSMLRWIVDTAADVDAFLFVSARTPKDVIFKNELEWMSSRHSGIRVAMTMTNRWTGGETWTGLTGRCDASMLKLLVPDLHERHAFMCGPSPFMEAVKECLRAIEFPIAQLHLESFGEARVAKGEKVQPRDVPKHVTVTVTPGASDAAVAAMAASAVAALPAEPQTAARFTVAFSKASKNVKTDGDASLLDLAEANGIEINYGCRSGSCGDCKVQVSKGTVDYGEHCEITDDEKKKGLVYACIARPLSDVEVVA
jgi:ferredoxin-NADP reductase/ferredoxin